MITARRGIFLRKSGGEERRLYRKQAVDVSATFPGSQVSLSPPASCRNRQLPNRCVWRERFTSVVAAAGLAELAQERRSAGLSFSGRVLPKRSLPDASKIPILRDPGFVLDKCSRRSSTKLCLSYRKRRQCRLGMCSYNPLPDFRYGAFRHRRGGRDLGAQLGRL